MIAAAVVTIAAIAVVLYVRFRDDVDAVTVDDAVTRFEQRTSTTTEVARDASTTTGAVTSAPAATFDQSAAPTLPEPGVYTYAARGREGVDALGGTTHEYPAETAVTVEPFGCGVRVEWTPFAQRVEAWTMCVRDGGIAVVDYASDHEFFNTADHTELTCDPPNWIVPPPGITDGLTTTCTGSGLVEQREVSIVGPSAVVVGGVTVDGVELEIAVTTTGTTNGTSTRHLTIDGRGLPLVWSDTVANTTGTPVGDVHYSETFALTLTSLEPRL